VETIDQQLTINNQQSTIKMKHHLLLLALTILSQPLSAQSEKYLAAMTEAVARFDSAKTVAQHQEAANTFARIASAEPAEWLPAYYAAFSRLRAGIDLLKEEPAKALQAFDLAQTDLDQARALAPQESEIAVLQAYILIGRVMESPMVKGQTLSPRVFAELAKAEALNPQNPRGPFLRGMYTLNMPDFYGGGAAKARPFFEQAAALYDKAPAAGLAPHWGKASNTKLLARLNEAEGGK
jgi:hypothetical protein